MTHTAYRPTKQAYLAHIMEAGIMGVTMYSSTTDTAMMALPMTMKGRNLPNLPSVLSIRAPMMGSVMASKTRMPVTIMEAKTMAMPSTALPKVAI